MPDIQAIHFGLIALAAFTGVAIGWTIRNRRCAREKAAINLGWQEQLEAQRLEHARLVEQNKSLMEQVSQFKTSGNEATNRSNELSAALKDALAHRDDLQREIKDVRGNLESVLEQRRKLQSDMRNRSSNDRNLNEVLAQKDDKIFKLSRELESWQQRVPPLVERFREREAEADGLRLELAQAHARVQALESVLGSDETRVEPVDPDALSDGMDASNDPADASARHNDISIDDVRDDLKCIKGIGPAIEKTLNELGIFRLSQIADMTEYDIDRVANRLKGFRSRIYREDWIGQARELQLQPPGES